MYFTSTMPHLTSCCLTLALAGTALAGDWPSVINQMPDDAQIVIFTKPLKEFDDHYSQFTAAIEVAQLQMMPSPIGALGMIGINTDAMNLDGSIGIAVLKNRWDADLPPILAFVPISNYDVWTTSVGAQAIEGTNLSMVNFAEAMGQEAGENDQWFVRSIDNYALLSPDRNLVNEYVAGHGNVGKWRGIVGELGGGIASNCDLTALIDFDGLHGLLKEGVNERFDEMGNQMGMMPPGLAGPGLDPADLEQMMVVYHNMLSLVIDEMQAAAVGIRFDANGAAFDFSLQWKPDGKMAALMPGLDGKSKNILNQFSDDPFMFASNADLSGVKFDELVKIFTEDLPKQMTMGLNQFGADAWGTIDGLGMVMYPSPAGIMGGLFNGLAIIYRGDGRTIRDQMMKTMLALNDAEMPGGMKVNYTFDEASKEVAGVPVDAWKMTFSSPPEMEQQIQQMMQMTYGPAGPGGYIAQLEDGVVMTMSRNSKLLEKVILSAKENNGVGRNTAVRAVDGLLSPNPSATFYIGIGAILEQVAPMATMFVPGLNLDPDTLRTIPPIATSISITGGGIQGTLAVPAPTIRFGAGVANDLMQAQMGGGNMGGEDEDPDIF